MTDEEQLEQARENLTLVQRQGAVRVADAQGALAQVQREAAKEYAVAASKVTEIEERILAKQHRWWKFW